jgi:cytochrome c oxidase subunit 4
MTQADAHHKSHGGAGHADHGDEPHVLPLSIYFGVWSILVFLTVVTVVVSRFDFGSANTLVALFVATVKGSLVALYFMHLRYDNKLYLLVLLASLMFVAIFFTPTLIDLTTRDALDPIKGQKMFQMYKQ